MNNAFVRYGVQSQYADFVPIDGSAQAPVLPSDEVLVKQGPGSDVWETHRPTIKRLYLDEDKTLKDMMAIMQRDYDHKATAKMYKSRFNKWGLHKNCKADEMMAIARKKVERDAIGKASSFRIRGQQVGIEEVLRHFKRKSHHSLEELVVRERHPRPATPSDIEVSTPGPSLPSPTSDDAQLVDSAPMTVAEAEFTPSLQRIRGYGHKRDPARPSSDLGRRQSLWMSNNRRRIYSLGRISPSLEPPRDLFVPERLFSAIKTLIQSSWDRDLWSTDEDGDLVSRKRAISSMDAIYDFQGYCLTAQTVR